MLPGFIYRPTGEIDKDFLYDRDERITDTWTRGAQIPSSAVALIVQQDRWGDREQIQGLGLFERGDAVTSFERRISVEFITMFDEPVESEPFVQSLTPRVRTHAADMLDRGGPVPPATWTAMREVLLRDSLTRSVIERFEARTSPPRWVDSTSRATQIVAFEQDALGLALSLEGLDRRRELQQWVPPSEPAPFLQGLEHSELREDQLLIHDMQRFGDWDRTDINGVWATFSSRNGDHLVVMNVNRHPIETTLGADLIYYSALHKAFTVVQYKRMRRESSSNREPVYRPAHDRNLTPQLNRMRELEAGMLVTAPRQLNEYRLGTGMCYLKICKPDLHLANSDLAGGMYIGVGMWDLVLERLCKPGSYPAITFDRGVRHFSNTMFIDLVQGGWIGSYGEVTTEIERYIARALDNKHSVTLATGTG